MSKGLGKTGLWGIVIWAVCIGGSASGASFTYEPITGAIESASFSVDFAAFTANRTVMGYELNYVKLVDLTGDLGTYDLSDDFFGTAAWPEPPKINMGALQTGIVSAQIDQSFFPALAGGHIGLDLCFTDTGDSMFALDFISLTLETASETVTSYYGWPVGNENNGFGIGLADGADLPAPLPVSIPVGATETGFDETDSSIKKVPEPATLILLGLGGAYLLRRRGKIRPFFPAMLVLTIALAQTALGISFSNVKLYQMDFYGTAAPRIYDTNWGDFKFTIVPDNDANDYFLNLSIRKDANSPTFWVIDNMMIPRSSDLNEPFTLSRYFSIEDLVESGTALGSLEYSIQISTWPTSTAPATEAFVPTTVLDGLDDTGNGRGRESIGGPVGPGAPPRINPPAEVAEPNIEKNTRDDVPNVGENRNECALGSTARSLLWLHKKKLIDLKDKADANKLMDLLKDHDHMDWDPCGVKDPCFLRGKLKISKSLKIVNKFVTRKNHSLAGKDFNTPDGTAHFRSDDPNFDFIRGEIDANEDIEIGVVWIRGGRDINEPNFSPDDPCFSDGGHWLTLVGYSEDKGNHNQQVTVQDNNQQQGRNDPNNDRRNTRYSQVNGVMTFNDLEHNYVDIMVSESPDVVFDEVHVDPVIDLYSPDLAVGTAGTIKASVQLGFVGVPGADVEFIKRAGSFTFTSGIILPDGSKTVNATDNNGFSEVTIRGDEPGPALIEVAVTGAKNSSAFLFFNIISCPLSANLDNDCDVDFEDYAIFANQWFEEDLAELSTFCVQWLEGK
jgi:hypothetical protein